VRQANGSQAHCPYCYEEISRRPAWFRCTGQLSPAQKRCAPAVDQVLRDRTGFAGALPPAFAAARRASPVECPDCRGKTTIRVCPVCHSRLPVHFGEIDSHLIVPVGAKEAGKTVFMTVLVHELMHRAGQQFNAAVTGADDYTRHRFPGDYESPLYHERPPRAGRPAGEPRPAARAAVVLRHRGRGPAVSAVHGGERPLPQRRRRHSAAA
jgi:hypothetical protein